MPHLVNPFERAGKWYKANLHTHTTASDGHLSLPEVVALYRKNRYDVLAITDHRATNDVRGLSDPKMLVISATEYHPPLPRGGGNYHLVAINVPHGFEFTDITDPNRCIAEVNSISGVSFLAHPYWSGIEYEDFRQLKHLAAVEVYNTTCDGPGRACSENEWAYALDRRMRLPAVAVDDAHFKHDPPDAFGGWTWLKMRSRTVASVCAALRTGSFYASCGPTIHDFRIENRMVTIRCSPAQRIQFMGRHGKGLRRLAPEGKTIRSLSMPVPDWPFIRAVVTDRSGNRAWTNPIYLDAT